MTLDAVTYLDLLLADDDEKSEALKLNSKIARMLHNQTVPTGVIEKEADQLQIPFDNKPHETLYWFKQMMQRGDNMINIEGGDIIWAALKKFDKSGKMP